MLRVLLVRNLMSMLPWPVHFCPRCPCYLHLMLIVRFMLLLIPIHLLAFTPTLVRFPFAAAR